MPGKTDKNVCPTGPWCKILFNTPSDNGCAEAPRQISDVTSRMRKYWYTNCPVCGNGRLFVVKDLGKENLLLVCEECESAWRNPEETVDPQKSFNISGLRLKNADKSDVTLAGWFRYDLHEVDS